MVPTAGIRVKGFKWDLFSTPLTLDMSSKFTGKEETFLIENYFSTYSLTMIFPKDNNPSSNEIETSGLTPVPLSKIDTTVWLE